MITEGNKMKARVLLELKRLLQNRFKWHVEHVSFYDNSNADKSSKGAQIVFLRLVIGGLKCECIFFFTKKNKTSFIWCVFSESTRKSTDMKIKYCVFESVHSVSNHKRLKERQFWFHLSFLMVLMKVFLFCYTTICL